MYHSLVFTESWTLVKLSYKLACVSWMKHKLRLHHSTGMQAWNSLFWLQYFFAASSLLEYTARQFLYIYSSVAFICSLEQIYYHLKMSFHCWSHFQEPNYPKETDLLLRHYHLDYWQLSMFLIDGDLPTQYGINSIERENMDCSSDWFSLFSFFSRTLT